jgi:hypothetical protein
MPFPERRPQLSPKAVQAGGDFRKLTFGPPKGADCGQGVPSLRAASMDQGPLTKDYRRTSAGSRNPQPPSTIKIIAQLTTLVKLIVERGFLWSFPGE